MRAAISVARPWIPISPESATGTADWRAEVAWSYPGLVAESHICALRSYISWARPWLFVSPDAVEGTLAWKSHLAWSIGCEEEIPDVAVTPVLVKHRTRRLIVNKQTTVLVLSPTCLIS